VLDKTSGKLVQRNLGEGLGLRNSREHFTIMRDNVTGLEYIRNSGELWEKGLYVELSAYHRHVFIDFREVQDDARHQYARLDESLKGRGVPSIDEALREMYLQPVHQPFRELMNAEILGRLLRARPSRRGRTPLRPDVGLLNDIEEKFLRFAHAAKQFSGGTGDEIALAKQVRREIETLLQLPTRRAPRVKGFAPALKRMQSQMKDDAAWATMSAWTFVHAVAQVQGNGDYIEQSHRWLDEWMLGKLIARALQDFSLTEAQARQVVAAVKLMTKQQRWFALQARKASRARLVLDAWFDDDETRRFLQINRYNNVDWFNKEAFETLIGWMLTVAFVSIKKPKEIVAAYEVVKALRAAEKKSKERVDKLLSAV
jgi:hypothetical protein